MPVADESQSGEEDLQTGLQEGVAASRDELPVADADKQETTGPGEVKEPRKTPEEIMAEIQESVTGRLDELEEQLREVGRQQEEAWGKLMRSVDEQNKRVRERVLELVSGTGFELNTAAKLGREIHDSKTGGRDGNGNESPISLAKPSSTGTAT